MYRKFVTYKQELDSSNSTSINNNFCTKYELLSLSTSEKFDYNLTNNSEIMEKLLQNEQNLPILIDLNSVDLFFSKFNINNESNENSCINQINSENLDEKLNELYNNGVINKIFESRFNLKNRGKSDSNVKNDDINENKKTNENDTNSKKILQTNITTSIIKSKTNNTTDSKSKKLEFTTSNKKEVKTKIFKSTKATENKNSKSSKVNNNDELILEKEENKAENENDKEDIELQLLEKAFCANQSACQTLNRLNEIMVKT